MKFVVEVPEVHIQKYEVEASSVEEAEQLVEDYISFNCISTVQELKGPTYSHSLEKDEWTTQEEE